MTQIIPAVLESTLDDILARLTRVRGLSRVVQVDVVDGKFTPSQTWPYTNAKAREEFEHIASQEAELPLWKDFDFQFDLMVAHPEEVVEQWVSAGASSLIVHAAAPGMIEALHALQEKRGGEYGVEVGIALLPSVSSEAFAPFAALVDFVQVMGIEKVGFQGEPFAPASIKLVRELRAAYPELALQVDGHVNRENIGALRAAGASRFAVGSALFESSDIKEELRLLCETAEESMS